jgi:F-type H+-transporting ATPase subunit b
MDFLQNALQNAEFWVLVALVILVIVLIAAKVPGVAAKALDAHGERIQAELDEAKRLREEAQALLASLTAQREQAEALAKEMLDNAKAEAKLMTAEAKAKLDEQITRRAEMAERRIANAEVQATAEVKAAAADLAAHIAETVLTARIATSKSDPLVDAALAQLPDKLN